MHKPPGLFTDWAAALWTLAAAGSSFGCMADSSTLERTGPEPVAASVQPLHDFCQRRPNHPHCHARRCGNGVVDPGEACDDGNREPGDGCSARCELDDVLSTPGDDRPGYLVCRGAAGPETTCGPGQGCCLNGTDADPSVAVCAAALSDCEVTPAFETCDGHEDCPEGTRCRGTRFGNQCGQGYYDVCHTAADCDETRPYCNEGICQGVPPEDESM